MVVSHNPLSSRGSRRYTQQGMLENAGPSATRVLPCVIHDSVDRDPLHPSPENQTALRSTGSTLRKFCTKNTRSAFHIPLYQIQGAASSCSIHSSSQHISHDKPLTMDITMENAAVGIVGLIGLNLALKAVSHLFKTFLRPPKQLKRLGKWAVVTGATGKSILRSDGNGQGAIFYSSS